MVATYYVHPSEIIVNAVLKKALKNDSNVYGWPLDEENEEKTGAIQFQVADFSSNLKTVYLAHRDSESCNLIDMGLLKNKIVLSIICEEIQYICAGILEYDFQSKLYYVTFNQNFFRGTHRKYYRLMQGKLVNIRFKIEDEEYCGLDVSIEGAALKVPLNRIENFPSGNIIEDSVLVFNNKKFNIPSSKIVYANIYKDQNYAAIGIQFLDLPQQVKEELTGHTLSETPHKEIRKVILMIRPALRR